MTAEATDIQMLYMSTNYGANWVQLANAGTATWAGVAMSSDGSTIFAAAQGGGIYRQVDLLCGA